MTTSSSSRTPAKFSPEYYSHKRTSLIASAVLFLASIPSIHLEWKEWIGETSGVSSGFLRLAAMVVAGYYFYVFITIWNDETFTFRRTAKQDALTVKDQAKEILVQSEAAIRGVTETLDHIDAFLQRGGKDAPIGTLVSDNISFSSIARIIDPEGDIGSELAREVYAPLWGLEGSQAYPHTDDQLGQQLRGAALEALGRAKEAVLQPDIAEKLTALFLRRMHETLTTKDPQLIFIANDSLTTVRAAGDVIPQLTTKLEAVRAESDRLVKTAKIDDIIHSARINLDLYAAWFMLFLGTVHFVGTYFPVFPDLPTFLTLIGVLRP